MKRIQIVMLVILAAIGSSVYAQKPAVVVSDKEGWHKIGEVNADFKTESESITVMGQDKFQSIKLKVTDAPINIQSVQVLYESGEKEDVPVSNELQAGKETKVFALKNPAKDISKVVFRYKTVPNSKTEKAHVELYGLKS